MMSWILTVFVCTASSCSPTPYPMDPAYVVFGTEMQCQTAGLQYANRVRREIPELSLDWDCSAVRHANGGR